MAHAQPNTTPNPAANWPYFGPKVTPRHFPSRQRFQSAHWDLHSVFPSHRGFYMGGPSQLNHQRAQGLGIDVTDGLLVMDGC